MIFRSVSVLATAALALTGCANGAGRPGDRERLAERADVSAVVAADLAFARLAREEGQWTAFRETMGDGAVMFVPQMTDARDWLADQTEPAQSAVWRPERVVSSCDGTLAASLGSAIYPDGNFGRYIIVWERQRDGSYLWVLDTAETTREPSETPEMIASTVAPCSPAPSGTSVSAAAASAASDDRTLRYTLSEDVDGWQELEVSYWDGQEFEVFYRRTVPAAATR